ncbi:ABC transporter permease [Rhizobium sp. CF142]|uniref:ABC transporter permease n=1 Tax=Rhizobium sp. CF142 TaxID=1144314 RepID=UPI00026EEC1A|nr:ABC transporter permease [Rhizobium sp. CF142]EJJ26693.1 ABC-type spermidine/putrescine transport system, permease component II [Rhizobium sp. CF142]
MAELSYAAPHAIPLRRQRIPPMTWLVAASIPVLAFLLVPILIVVPMAFTRGQILIFPPQLFSVRPFTDLFGDASWMSSALDSLKIGLLATAIAVTVGVSAAMALHNSKLIFKGMLVAVILLPIMIPAIVMALGFYLFFQRIGLTGSWQAIAFAHSVAITPYVFIATQASLAGVDPTLPRAARSLGAGALDVFLSVYWPAIKPGVIGGGIFAFIGSFDEIVISLFLSGPGVVPLPVQMYTSLQNDLTPKVAAVSAMLFLLSLMGLAAQAYQHRSRVNKSKFE